jgi:hypothetical protein
MADDAERPTGKHLLINRRPDYEKTHSMGYSVNEDNPEIFSFANGSPIAANHRLGWRN